jgi:hypothetical protein
MIRTGRDGRAVWYAVYCMNMVFVYRDIIAASPHHIYYIVLLVIGISYIVLRSMKDLDGMSDNIHIGRTFCLPACFVLLIRVSVQYTLHTTG